MKMSERNWSRQPPAHQTKKVKQRAAAMAIMAPTGSFRTGEMTVVASVSATTTAMAPPANAAVAPAKDPMIGTEEQAHNMRQPGGRWSR